MNIIFSTGPHLGSVLLRAILFSEWSHCGIVTEDGSTVIEASAAHGVVETPIEKFTRYGRYAIVECPVPDPVAAYAAARAELGKGYDWIGLLGLAVVKPLQSDDRWFCSELVQHVKVAGGLRDLRYGTGRITPRDLWNLPYEVIFAAGIPVGAQ